jgi:hypothetical protein
MIKNTSLYSYLCGVNPEVVIENGLTGYTQQSPVNGNWLVFNQPGEIKLPSTSGLLVIQQCVESPTFLAAKYMLKEPLDGIQINGTVYPARFSSLLIDDKDPGSLQILDEQDEIVDCGISLEDVASMRTLFLTAVAEKFHRVQARSVVDLDPEFAS